MIKIIYIEDVLFYNIHLLINWYIRMFDFITMATLPAEFVCAFLFLFCGFLVCFQERKH